MELDNVRWIFFDMGNGGKRVSGGHLHKVQSDPKLGALTKHSDKARELCDNQSE